MRHFIRHPADIPIEIRRATETGDVHGYNVGIGGLALSSGCPLEIGIIVDVRIPFVQPAFETRARVCWCSPGRNGFDVGVAFLDRDDAFRARMVEQVCSIGSYQRSLRSTEGRDLTIEQAALEWIDRYAAKFSSDERPP